ncbi:related to transcription initiation factor TFIIF subunit [Cephalotrichum gorgonifer]|uniref:Transcription initiation factor IIF subunit beta n=1 Tax=Cephalotrichum gorgonifer TaxID=2041049 RepID=A0AAE8MQJ7_9PEZI|nr:related to transcription initiation factor TFIIF subunit [Cephalotrichum gorgonifer]
MADQQIKSEPSVKSEPFIKSEVKAEPGTSPSPFEDDDLYEDAGDLEFYDPNGPVDFAHLYLAHIPNDLWKAWSQLNDKDEIQIGTMRVWDEPVRVGQEIKNVPRRKMLLNPQIAQHQGIPREYNLNTHGDFNEKGSHFLFSEEDLPGFKEKSRNTGLPLSVLRARSEKVEKPKWERGAKYVPYFRKAIPKKTKIVGRLVHEMTSAPVLAEQREHLIRRQIDEFNKGGKTGLMSKGMGQAIRTGTVAGGDWEINLIKSQPKVTKAKKVEMKTIRIPENELMDQIFQCFAKYQYWSLKSLRAQLKQPEAYLRQTLEKIAVLNKTGRFANNWSLKEENIAAHQSNVGGDVAPEDAGDGSDVDDDDVEMKMEDAL